MLEAFFSEALVLVQQPGAGQVKKMQVCRDGRLKQAQYMFCPFN